MSYRIEIGEFEDDAKAADAALAIARRIFRTDHFKELKIRITENHPQDTWKGPNEENR